MKKFEKIIFLGVVIIIIILFGIYKIKQNSNYEKIDLDNIVIKTQDIIQEEKNMYILHITGEVNNPRNY